MELESKCLPNIHCYKAIERWETKSKRFHSSKPKILSNGAPKYTFFPASCIDCIYTYIHTYLYIYREREREIHIHFLSMWVHMLYFLHSISSSLSLFWDISNFLPTSRSEETPRRDPEIRGRLGHIATVSPFTSPRGLGLPLKPGREDVELRPGGCGNSGAMTPSTWSMLQATKTNRGSMKCFVKMDPKWTSFIVYIYIYTYITTQVLLAFPGPNLETGWRKGKGFRSCVAYLLENIYRC